ncbi:hypothetical protein GCM10010992_19110 [Cloacibacterium rupense]|uniref:Phosphate-selective porin O and P n=1 Tax=Cloacibacterium rupense TaxID=517423 RepID=A0ABQ2NK70_9FLAO|nr:hypothetical protein [Cloacibacterium rupense]GGP04931.1 hypothetical protein GCM10010992_19110 [Cloacibacterium rupense]
MKTLWIKAAVLSTVLASTAFYAQETTMRDYLAPEKTTRNVFEDPKGEAPEYDGVKVVVGGDFALQFQSLDHSTKGTLASGVSLNKMGSDFNLPTANLDINAYLAKGVKMHLRTYLSARHHNEAWVKGGYIQIDNLDFISQGFLSGLMKNARVKVGMDEINYGDSHFRRTDNAEAINNPFVENNIMDSFTTQAFGEAYYYSNGFMGMLGVSNGKLNQSAVKGTSDNSPSVYAKLAYDKQINPDLRVRLSGSIIKTNGLNTNGKLYGDDRAGSRYYYVLLTTADAMGTSNPSTGRFNPGFQKMTAIQINPFVKYQGLEFFGTYEHASGNKIVNATTPRSTDGSYNQYAAELLYRFGGKEQFYLGGKYNAVSGKDYDGAAERKIDRFNIAGGWFMTKNILAKVEYVNQKYNESAAWGTNTALYGGKFNGFVLEATIGF